MNTHTLLLSSFADMNSSKSKTIGTLKASKTLGTLTAWKKRRITENEQDSGILRSVVPSNKELCVTLFGGEDKIVAKDHVDGSGKKVLTGWTIDSKKKVTWIAGNGWTNPKSKLITKYGSTEAVYDAYYSIKTAEAKGIKDTSSIQNAIKVATGHTPEVTSAMGWMEMIVDNNW